MNDANTNLTELLQHGFRYALSLTHNQAMAEDLLQDAWVGILKADGPHNKPYLFKTIRNRYINQNKRDRLVPMVPLDTEQIEERDAGLNIDLDPGLLQNSLSSLRPVEREVMYLFAVEEYTAQEIADYTGQPRGTVLSLLHRSRKKLREQFSNGLDEVKP